MSTNATQQTLSAVENKIKCTDWQNLLERIPYARYLELEVQRDDAGLVVHMPCCETLIGNFMLPALHGGALAALIELTGRIAAQRQDTETRCPRILDSYINYLRPARTESTFASAEVIRQGRRTSLVRVKCWQGEKNKLIACGQVQLLFPAMAAK